MHRNGRRLFADGLTLFELGRHASAVVLTGLAQEEFGKATFMGIFAVAEDSADLRKLWRDGFVDHKHKNRMSILVGLVVGHLGMKSKDPTAPPISVAADELFQTRLRSMYVDCVAGPEEWSIPDLVVGADLAGESLKIAFASMAKSLRPSQVVGHFAETWSEVLRAHPETAEKRPTELPRAEAALLWSKSYEAGYLDAADRAEARSWGVSMSQRLVAAGVK